MKFEIELDLQDRSNFKDFYGMTFEQFLNDIKHDRIKGANDYVLYNDYAEIILRNVRGEIKKRGLISLDQINKIKDFRWYEDGNGYIMSKINNKIITLHRFIMGTKINELVDHINGDRLDCRNENLRIVTQSQNAMNAKKPNNNTSGIKGVSFSKTHNKWRAYITANKKQIDLGRFNNFEDAVNARLQAEKQHFKEFRYEKGENE
jgi:hypothetical protein